VRNNPAPSVRYITSIGNNLEFVVVIIANVHFKHSVLDATSIIPSLIARMISASGNSVDEYSCILLVTKAMSAVRSGYAII
jgi:hypothetical protein